MALVDLVDAMQTAFTARSCPVPILLGKQYLHDNGGDNRIVIVPSEDGYGPKDPSLATPQVVIGGKSLNPRPLMTRMVGATAHLWAMCALDDTADADVLAEDHRYMNALINCFCACLNGVAGGVSTITGGTYSKDKATHMRRGLVYELSFAVNIPIIDVEWHDGTTTYPEEADVDADVTINATDPAETLLEFSTAEAE